MSGGGVSQCMDRGIPTVWREDAPPRGGGGYSWKGEKLRFAISIGSRVLGYGISYTFDPAFVLTLPQYSTVMKSIYYLFLGFLSLLSCLPSNLPKPAEELQKPEPQQIHLQGKTQLGQTLSIAGLPSCPMVMPVRLLGIETAAPYPEPKTSLPIPLPLPMWAKGSRWAYSFYGMDTPPKPLRAGMVPMLPPTPQKRWRMNITHHRSMKNRSSWVRPMWGKP